MLNSIVILPCMFSKCSANNVATYLQKKMKSIHMIIFILGGLLTWLAHWVD